MKNVQPRMLIGLQHTHLLTSRKTVEGREGEPVAKKTKLGWVVFGRSQSSSREEVDRCHFTSATLLSHQILPLEDDRLHNQVEPNVSTKAFVGKQSNRKDEPQALDIIDRTLRHGKNVYEAELTWKSDNVQYVRTIRTRSRCRACSLKRKA